ncbi:ATP synthase F1 subunit gamma [Candidatus Falkowbacteria bacterium]|nr:ATP synthase F1 subunit gamma [Candidatus Falkowbacteria bacterium]
MAVSTKIIRRRIKSITNTKKITKAMEMVAASKMRKAQLATLRTRDYANRAWSLIYDLSGKTDSKLHSFLVKKDKVKKVCVVLISSDRGLCGGFNAQIIKKVAEFSKSLIDKGIEMEFLTVGKKSRDFTARHKIKLVADFTNLSSVTRLAEIRAIAKIVIDDFSAGKYDEVYLAYTDFISTISQRPRILKLLPFTRERDLDLGKVGEEKTPEKSEEREHEFLFEPSPDMVLEYMLPKMAEMQIFQAILESNASEHSARMVAMKNASDSAEDMIFDLTLMYNQVRQSAITKEIMEIVSGKAALE